MEGALAGNASGKRIPERSASVKPVPEISHKLLVSKDISFSHIAFVSKHTVVYKFDGEKWHRTSVEGPLYIYKRKTIPTTAIFLINRKSPQDFFIGIDRNISGYEAHGDFMVLKRSAAPRGRAAKGARWIEVYGFWFYNKQDAAQMEKIVRESYEKQKKTRELEGLLRLGG